jgi:hypothetical protein
LALLVSLFAPLARPQDTLAATPTDPGWPRTFTSEGNTVILHQPQVDSWPDHETIRFRAALEVTPAGASEPSYGVLAGEAETDVEPTNTTVFLCNIKLIVRFPYSPPDQAQVLSALVKEVLPHRPYITLSVNRVLAYMHDEPLPKGVPLNLAPPPIFYSASPAILVNFLGAPEFKPIKDTQLMFAVNTNWLVLMDTQGGQYYLLDKKSWLQAPEPVHGQWTAARKLPADFSRLPNDKAWDEVRQNLPGVPAKVIPDVFVSTVPAELIVTNGAPTYTPIPGTSLLYVNNPVMPVFMDLSSSSYYYLAAGRWFSAPRLSGPWSAATTSLPAEFARIPADSAMSFVLPSVPGTIASRDAILLASIPHKATVNASNAKLTVDYDGTPKFVSIQGTPMSYAVNTSDEVVQVNNQYYCCHKGVWFAAPAPQGPWSVCTSVPPVIYTIPPTCPLYNATFVKVYSSTGSSVVVGYTSGYDGEYVSTDGTLMFGSGAYAGEITTVYPLYGGYCPYYPCCYSYGCGAWYHPGYCGYCTGGAAHYGPYGGVGYGAAYNPATGTYSRAAYAYGPGGTASVRQAYNPYGNTYGAHAGASNGYGSWGASTVSHGDKWASASHETNVNGVTRASAQNSSGQWAEAAHFNNTTVAAGSSGDLYAGHDGNVYKRTDSGWQSYGDGGWNNVEKPTQMPSSQSRPNSAAPGGGSSTPKSSWNMNDWNDSWGATGGGGSSQDAMAQHDNEASLNRDSWSRGYGNSGGGWGGGGGYAGGFRGAYGGFRGGGFGRR